MDDQVYSVTCPSGVTTLFVLVELILDEKQAGKCLATQIGHKKDHIRPFLDFE